MFRCILEILAKDALKQHDQAASDGVGPGGGGSGGGGTGSGGGGGGLDQGTGGFRGIGQEELLLETSRRVTARYVSGWIHLILTP